MSVTVSSKLGLRVIAKAGLSKYVYVREEKTGTLYPIKRINKPSSRFSKAHWLRATSPIAKDFKPKIVYEDDVLGEIHYRVYENVLAIPKNFSYTSRLA